MRIYTKTGDKGETGLLGGKRVSKTDPRIEAYGSIDELNAVIGVIRSFGCPKDIDRLLERIQNNLFDLGVTLVLEKSRRQLRVSGQIRTLDPKDTEFLEKQIDFYDAKNPALRNFILPGGTKVASLFHLARTVCRRTERKVIKLRKNSIPYLNRLSDLLFVLARYENTRVKKKEVMWKGLRRL